jgi:hypothetical protein
VFELGEDAEHLQHHPPRRRVGVERLGRRLEHDVERVEFFGELSELANLAREPVDPVAEQQVDSSFARVRECALQTGPVELGSGRLVLLVGDDPPLL